MTLRRERESNGIQRFCRTGKRTDVVSVPKDTLAKLIVVSEINNVELEGLINCILEKGIEEHGFYA